MENKPSILRLRLTVMSFFFLQGLCFSSWASRIPTIKTALHISDGGLGTLLLALPAGQLTMMPFSGRLANRYGSKATLMTGLMLYSLALTNLGAVTQAWQLAVALYLFGLAGNLSNISVNTQGVNIEKMAGRQVMASFHGAWSLAGFTGGAIGAFMIANMVSPYLHFWIIAAIVFTVVLTANRNLLPGRGITEARPFFTKPDKALIQLGVIGFCNLACEGAMFDWSGVYFQKVIHAPASLITLGYIAFMSTMAGGRFVGDRLVRTLGQKRMLKTSGILVATGLVIAVVFPYILTATLGFLIVGLGVSSVVPTVYSAAGRSTTVSPSIAIASVSSISFLGFLMGPPLLGYIAQTANLRYSYALVAAFGLATSILASRARLLK